VHEQVPDLSSRRRCSFPASARPEPFDAITKAAADTGKGEVEKKVNEKLLQEARKNQCSFKSGTAELAPGCDAKLKKLSSALVDAKRQLDSTGAHAYKFEVSGPHRLDRRCGEEQGAERAARADHRQASWSPAASARERSSPWAGAARRCWSSPTTPAAKKQKNRRYEIRVRL
jgi:hypothetical protein